MYTRALYIHARTVRASQPTSQPANDIRVEVFTERHLATTCLDALALAPSNFPIIERSPSIRTRSHMTRAHVRRYIHRDRVTHTGAGIGLCVYAPAIIEWSRSSRSRGVAQKYRFTVYDKGLCINVVPKIKYLFASASFRLISYFRIDIVDCIAIVTEVHL